MSTKTKAKNKAARGKSTKGAKPRGAAAIQVIEDTPDANAVPTEEPAPKAVGKRAKTAAEPKPKKLSALDAAAKVLAESTEPLSTKQMVEAMSSKGYWTSPGGKTPHATLYSAILREIGAQGTASRFVKTERGRFAAKA